MFRIKTCILVLTVFGISLILPQSTPKASAGILCAAWAAARSRGGNDNLYNYSYAFFGIGEFYILAFEFAGTASKVSNVAPYVIWFLGLDGEKEMPPAQNNDNRNELAESLKNSQPKLDSLKSNFKDWIHSNLPKINNVEVIDDISTELSKNFISKYNSTDFTQNMKLSVGLKKESIKTHMEKLGLSKTDEDSYTFSLLEEVL